MNVTVSVGGKFHAFHLARELHKRGYLQKIITSYPNYLVQAFNVPAKRIDSLIAKEIGERLYHILKLQKIFGNPQYFFAELFDRQAAKKIKPCDVFVGWSSGALHSMRRAKELGAKTVVERGSSHIEYQNEVLKQEYDRWGIQPLAGSLPHPRIIEKELCEYSEADAIAVPSLFVKKTFVEKGMPEKKLLHVPYGVDLSLFYQISKTDSVFRIIFVGGMTIRKGVHYLLQVFHELNLPNAELLLIGALHDELKPFFKKYKGSFRWIPHVAHEQLYQYYSQSSIFAISSIEEGLALVQPQAMACGLPVLATENAGARDIIRNGIDGYIIPIRNNDALKEKILHMYDNPDLCRSMGASAKHYVQSRFTWDAYGAAVIRNYQNFCTL